MEVQGLNNFSNMLNRSISNFDIECNKMLVTIGNKFLKKIKLKTPVNTGTLRRSWMMTKQAKEVIISNNVKYAMYVNYPHRTKNGRVVEGRYMLEKTVSEIESELDKEFSIMIDNLWK